MPLMRERFKNAWSAFTGRDPTPTFDLQMGYATSFKPDRVQLSRSNLKSVVSSVYNQIAVDCAAIKIQHVRVDENDKYLETIDDSLNRIFRRQANIDQTGRELIQDIVISLLDEGCVAVVPTLVDINPSKTDSYKIYEMRVGKILQWRPYEVLVELYNDLTGERKQRWCEKRTTAIIENPFYEKMNEPNSTAKRLIRVLNQLDRTNEENSAGKLDLIVQLPYLVKSDARLKQAEKRRKDIEAQLTGSQYGIAYIDGTEKIIQLNRGIENNLWTQATELKADLYNELGFSDAIFDGTADEQTMLNYNNRTIEPIMSAITENMERKWISETAYSQRQGIRFFKDPFKLVPVSQIAEIADKFTRNEIMTSNEIRSVVGMRPVDDPKANELRNANLNHPDEEGTTSTVIDEVVKEQ